MKATFLLGALAGVMLLSGCAGIEEMNAKAEAEQRAADQSKCVGFGFQPGTDGFASCMMQTQHNRDQAQADRRRQDSLDRQHQQEQKARDAAAARDASAKHEAEIGQMMRSDQGFTPTMPKMPSGTNCTSTTTASQTGNAGSSQTTTICH